MILAPHPDEGLDALLAGGVLDALLPEVKAMVGFGDGEWRHKDVWKHTKQVVRQSVPRLEVRWARPVPRHRQGARRAASPRRRGALLRPRRGRRRACSTSWSVASACSREDALRDTIHFLDPAPPAREPVRRRAGRTARCVASRARWATHLDDLLVPVARRHHHQAPGEEAPRHRHDRRARGSHHGPRRGGREGAAAADGRRQRDHGGLRAAALAADR